MKLTRVEVENFRCHRESTVIEIDDFVALIGRGDAGKSSILEAMQIFFNDGAPDGDDAHKSSESKLCRIACEFDNVPASIVIDATHETTLAGEYLLNERGRLEIHKVYDCSLKTPKLKEVYARAQHPAGEKYCDLLTLKQTELKKRAKELGVDLAGVDERANSPIRHAIWESAANLELADANIPLAKEDGKEVYAQLQKAMPLFQLFKSDRPSTDQDAEAQDPMRIAVKEAIAAQEAALADVAKQVEASVREIAERTVEKIREMDATLANQLHPVIAPPKWDGAFKIGLTGDESIPVNKRGSGVRRLILLNFFRAKAENDVATKNASGVIYAIEEPETCQHPNTQRMLMQAFLELSKQRGCQVLITTHNPSLARLLPTESLRFIDCRADGSRAIHEGEDAASLVVKALGILADHSVCLFIGVEGANDIEFLRSISRALNAEDENLPDLQAMEDDGQVVFIPVGGSNLALWITRLKDLKIPEYHIYDRDNAPTLNAKCQGIIDKLNERRNCFAKCTHGRTIENYLHPDAINAARAAISVTFDHGDDVPAIVAEAVHVDGGGEVAWDDLDDDVRRKKESRAKAWLNRDAAAKMTMKMLESSDPDNNLLEWLSEMGRIVRDAQPQPAATAVKIAAKSK